MKLALPGYRSHGQEKKAADASPSRSLGRNPQQSASGPNPAAQRRVYPPRPQEPARSRKARTVLRMKTDRCNVPHSQHAGKNDTGITIPAETALDRIRCPLVTKALLPSSTSSPSFLCTESAVSVAADGAGFLSASDLTASSLFLLPLPLGDASYADPGSWVPSPFLFPLLLAVLISLLPSSHVFSSERPRRCQCNS